MIFSTVNNEISPIIVFFLLLLIPLMLILLLTFLILVKKNKDYIKTGFKEKTGNSYLTTKSNIGNLGEFQTYLCLINIFDKTQIFINAYLPGKNTRFAEVDIIVVAKVGIYIIEVKNLYGYVYGDSEDDYLETRVIRGCFS